MISILKSQNETKKWCFGVQAGLDFMTSPPTALTNSTMTAVEGCASIADAAGNILFYTDGATIYNQVHTVMANGSGVLGNSTCSQSSLILKQPGNATIYYVITQGSGTGGLNYSIIDMSLAAGIGSVTIKNSTLVAPAQCTEKLTGVKHCNGVDYWIVTHDWNSTNFRSYLLTSAGLNTVAVLSSAGSNYSGVSGYQGWLKISQNGKKLGATMYSGAAPTELFDFDNTTGVVSNMVSLTGAGTAYGCEFSPDGSKFYAAGASDIYQWDLCAASATAIVASLVSIQGIAIYAMQLAANGKIYVSRVGQQIIGTINNPNQQGVACNYQDLGQSVSPKTSNVSIPSFASGFLNQHLAPPSFTYQVNALTGCQTASFTAPPSPSVYCPAAGYSVTNLLWNFGDPLSGLANTSTLTNPTHYYSLLGTYTAQIIVYYSCGGGSDTIKVPVNITGPSLSVTTTSISCASFGSATVVANGGIGPYSYTWIPSGQTNSVATNLTPGTYSILVKDLGLNCVFTATTNLTPPAPLTATFSASNSVACNGAVTATANVTNIQGGSGNQSYLWTGGVGTQTNSFAIGLGAGNYSLFVTDLLSGCTYTQSFTITQPPGLTLNIAASSSTACAATNITLNATTSGGTPGFTYNWALGPPTSSNVVNKNTSGVFVFTVTSKDSYSCSITQTTSVNYIGNPTLSIANTSICPLETGTLNVSGAVNYTWSNNTNNASLSASPLTTTSYTVIGSTAGCSATANAAIVVKSLPNVTVTGSGTVCQAQSVSLYGGGGISYFWAGPQSFTANTASISINPITLANAGVYNVTVTAANACTATSSGSIVVNPNPTLSASGGSVCINQPLNLISNSSGAISFLWTGPSFTSVAQNTTIASPSLASSGNYTVKVTSAQGCSNATVVNVAITNTPQPIIISNGGQKCVGDNLILNGSGGNTYTWTGPNAFNSFSQSATLTNLSLPDGGTYTLTITLGPCVTFTTKTIVVFPLPTATAISSSTVCEGKSLNLTVITNPNIMSSYFWLGPNGFFNQTAAATISSVSPVHSGVYSISVADANTCKINATVSVLVLTNPIVTVSNVTVCLNQSATLTALGAANYIWFGSSGFLSTSQALVIPKNTNSLVATYSVIGFGANSCSASASASVSTTPPPKPSLSVSPNNKVCLNSTLTLTGDGGNYYFWAFPGNIFLNGKRVSFAVNNFGYSGTYTLTAIDSLGCAGGITTDISIYELPQGGLHASKTEACIPFCADFSFYSTSKNITSVWYLENKTFAANNFSYCFNNPSKYVLAGYLTDTISNCVNTVSLSVNGLPVPTADFTHTPEKPIENIDEVIFTNKTLGAQQGNWNWFFIDNNGYTSKQKNPSYTFRDAGTYPVAMIVKNEWGCWDSIIKYIKIEPDFNVYVPNVFTPNGDNLNDLFLPAVRGAKKYNLSVFDRWGKKLFETLEPLEGWDGNYQEKACQTDVYNWSLSVSAANGETKELKGRVTLYR